ncbi:MAG: YraN family protein [Janthinobacterium lividum]
MFAAVQRSALTLERNVFLRLRSLSDSRLAKRARTQGLDPKPAHLVTGERGEDLAYFHLCKRGYTIVARRWHSARLNGDLDLVGWDGETLVIFEVKTRTARDLAPAETAVNAAKQRTLGRMATAYRRRLPEPWRDLVPLRFDVLSVYDLPAGPEFEHIPNAFPLTLRSHFA